MQLLGALESYLDCHLSEVASALLVMAVALESTQIAEM
jgi:hypothetical protein